MFTLSIFKQKHTVSTQDADINNAREGRYIYN